jgi:hypothetical protein
MKINFPTKLFFVLILVVSNLTIADDKKKRVDKASWGEPDGASTVSLAPINLSPDPILFKLDLAPGFQTDAYIIGPEISTANFGSYDYKTNGEVNHYIQVDPAFPNQLHAIDVIADSLEPGGATSRRTVYSVSTNGGETWDNFGRVPEIRSGYPVLKLRNGAAIISNHNAASGIVNTNLYEDVVPQGGSFNQYLATLPFSIWPQIEVLSNGNVIVVSRPQHVSGTDFDTLFYQIWDGTALGQKQVAYISGPPYLGSVGSNMRFNVAQNGAGRITMAIHSVLENDTLLNSKVWSRTSTDNGVTWGPLELLFSPFYENGDDTVAIAGGSDLIYKPNSNVWVYSTAATSNNLYENARLYLIRSDGTRSVITTAAEVGATSSFASPMSFVFNLDQPALGYSEDGNVLYCVYAVVKPDIAPTGYNSRDIYFQRSLDDGTTWGPPVQVTNTPNIDECYASISNYNKGNATTPYDLNFTYMKDPGVGPSSFGGTAPASVNYQIYRKISEANVIGISNNNINVEDYQLLQNYPNPFNPATTISYNLIKGGFVTLKVFDILGREVKTLVREFQNPGVKEIKFDASSLTSGIYFYSISANGFNDIKKMMLLK